MKYNSVILLCILFCMIFVIGGTFFIFDTNREITGFVVSDGTNQSLNATGPGIITKQDAINAINEAENVINTMKNNNFSIIYADDSLLEANKAFQQAVYANILRNASASTSEKKDAEMAMSLIDWRNINYSGILIYTDEIKSREKRAFDIYDGLTASLTKISKYEMNGVNGSEARGMLNEANTAFYQDRYDDAEALIKKINDNLETKSSDLSSLNVLKSNAITFIEKNWAYVSGAFIICCLIVWLIYRKTSKSILLNRIRKMQTERKVLIGLIKKAQDERFNKNKLSALVYNIRMNKYKERMNKIDEDLPVLEKRLRKKGQ